jgi:hypothetical protein
MSSSLPQHQLVPAPRQRPRVPDNRRAPPPRRACRLYAATALGREVRTRAGFAVPAGTKPAMPDKTSTRMHPLTPAKGSADCGYCDTCAA